MSKFMILFRKELAEMTSKKRNFAFMFLAPALLIAVSLSIYPNLIESLSQAVPVSVSVPRVLDIYGFNFTLFLVLIVQATAAADIFVSEKTRKSLEATLTAPVSPSDVLFGKVAAIFSIGFSTAIASFLVVAVSLWAKYGVYLPSPYTLLHVLLVLPVISVLLLSVLGIIQLSTRYYAAATGLLTLIMWITVFIPSFFMTQMPNALSMFLMYASATAGLGLVLSKFWKVMLSKERIVISAN
jgi:ABC-type Na+ efflux pump permease subunit